MTHNIDDAPIHRLRLQAAPRRVVTCAEPRTGVSAPPEVWLYTGVVVTLAVIASTKLFALTHVR